VPEWKLWFDLVAIAPPVPLSQHVPVLDQVVEDLVSAALRDADRGSDVAKADPRIVSDTEQDVGMVGQKVPPA